MKVRTGFVSNSSSSSFIIGYGAIRKEKDLDTLKKLLKDKGIEFNEPDSDKYKYDYYGEVALFKKYMANGARIIQGGNETELIIPRNVAEDWNCDSFIRVEINNDEGDSAFTMYDEGEFIDMDYGKAKNESFYNEKQRFLIRLLKNQEGFTFRHCNVIIGAERNG